MTRNSIIFAIPRHDYASYRDLYRLIELSGFPTCFIDEVDPDSDNAYIVTILNGEVRDGGYLGSRARILLWDLEWHLSTDGYFRQPFAAPPGVEILAADKWYAEQIGARYVPMGSHPGLRETVTDHSKQYDVAYIGYINGVTRRERIRQQLIQRGVRVSPPTAWGTERDWLLNDSIAYLHVHQWDNVPTIAPLRMVVAAAYSLPVIIETVADAGIFEQYITDFDYNALAVGIAGCLNKPHNLLLAEEGQALHRLLCRDLTFRKSIEAAL